MCGFCSVWVCEWVLYCVGVSRCGFCNVWVCVGVGFVLCGGFHYCMGVLVICILIFSVFCIVSFMYVYSYLFCLYYCEDYCYRVTTQLQLVVAVAVEIMITQ
jgi:hypothetical protein